MKAWVLLALLMTGDGVVWKVRDRFEFRGECEEASLAFNEPGRPVTIVTCAWSPNAVVR